MPKFDVVTIGGAVKDHTLLTDKGRLFATPQNLTAQKMVGFEYGAKIIVKDAHMTLGGGAINSAVSLSRLGYKIATISRVGNDEVAREIIGKLKKEKINSGFIQTDKNYLTGFSFILITDLKDRDRTIFNYRGCAEMLLCSSSSLSKINANWFYLSSLSGPKWLTNVKAIFNNAKNKNTKIHWNPGSVQLQAGKRILAPFLKQTEILVLNKDEAIELVLSGIKLGRKNPNHLNKIIYLLNILHEWGPKIVMITDGKKGATVYDGNKVYRKGIKRSKVIDRTGVGDCYGSSFLAGYIATGSISEALNWATINSASVVSKIGAQNGLLFKKELISKLN